MAARVAWQLWISQADPLIGITGHDIINMSSNHYYLVEPYCLLPIPNVIEQQWDSIQPNTSLGTGALAQDYSNQLSGCSVPLTDLWYISSEVNQGCLTEEEGPIAIGNALRGVWEEQGMFVIRSTRLVAGA